MFIQISSLHVRWGCRLYHSLLCIIPQLKQSALISSRHLSRCLFYCSPSEPLSFNKAILSVQEVGLSCFSFFRTPSLIKDPPDVHKLLALFISLINYSFVEGLHLQEPRTWKELAHGSLIDTAEAECCFFKLGYSFLWSYLMPSADSQRSEVRREVTRWVYHRLRWYREINIAVSRGDCMTGVKSSCQGNWGQCVKESGRNTFLYTLCTHSITQLNKNCVYN